MAVTEPNGAVSFTSINPATGREVATYPGHSSREVRSILEEVQRAQKTWQTQSFDERAQCFRAIAAEFRAEADDLARILALEMGKPLRQGLAEVEKCAGNCEFYAAHATSFLADEELTVPQAFVRYQPLGTVLAIMPWNYPLWQVLRCAGPVLMAGNAMVLKHASNVMGSAIAIEQAFTKAGLPPNVFRTLKISSLQVESVIRNDVIAAVTLTGSEPAGRAVTAIAGSELKPCVLELGGSDPFVVLDDADLEEAARVGSWARNQNAGQSCIAAKRFIVVQSVYDAFVEKLVGYVGKLKVGDPLDPATEVGPLARRDLRDQLHDQVIRSVSAGARVILGGEVPEGPGAFYPPTVLGDVRPGVAAFEEETFGPVAALVSVRDEDEAVAMANQSRFGLGASVWTADPDTAERVASRIESGMVFINRMTQSDARLPFGGVKASGFGRELWVPGSRSFTNAKTVCR